MQPHRPIATQHHFTQALTAITLAALLAGPSAVFTAAVGERAGAMGKRSLPVPANAQTTESQTTTSEDLTHGYHNHADRSEALRTLAATHPDTIRLEALASSHLGRDIWLVQFAAPGALPADRRPVILIVAGVDADTPASSETATRILTQITERVRNEPQGDTATALARFTLWVIPCLDPDGIERFFAAPRSALRGNARPIDEDRDGAADEDGPNDLNGDGWIGVMRIPDPLGDWLPDTDDPRMLRRADRSKGQRGQYRLLSEGIDDDGDGQINEDGPGRVDLDRNWPHLYEPGPPETGPHQLSEPATRALAERVVENPRIAAALVFGRHDNIVSVPKGRDRGPDGESYRDLHPDDVALYEHLAERFREQTSLKAGPGASPAGTLYAWLYAQRGIFTLATSLWWVPEKADKPTDSQPADSQPTDSQPAATEAAPADPTDAADSSTDDPPAAANGQANPQAGQRAIRGGRRGGPGGPPDGRPPGPRGGDLPDSAGDDPLTAAVQASKALKSWLEYSDQQRGGAGWLEWQPVDHPEFGRVEVGGLRPYFTTCPPAAELDSIATAQADVLAELCRWLPAIRIEPGEIRHEGGGVWRVELRVTNDGTLPTSLAAARHARFPGFAIRPELDADRILGGRRIERIANLDGNGGAAELTWLIRGESGQDIAFHVVHRMHGEWTVSIRLPDSKDGQE